MEKKDDKIISLTAADFSKDDVSEINNYLATAVGFSNVLGSLYTLTDNPVEKTKVYVAAFRIINSCKNYVETKSINEKLDFIIADNYSLYLKLYEFYQLIQNSKGHWGKHKIYEKIVQEIMNKENMYKMNLLIDLFIMFAERQTKYDINKITGINLETPEGKIVQKEIYSNGDANAES